MASHHFRLLTLICNLDLLPQQEELAGLRAMSGLHPVEIDAGGEDVTVI